MNYNNLSTDQILGIINSLSYESSRYISFVIGKLVYRSLQNREVLTSDKFTSSLYFDIYLSYLMDLVIENKDKYLADKIVAAKGFPVDSYSNRLPDLWNEYELWKVGALGEWSDLLFKLGSDNIDNKDKLRMVAFIIDAGGNVESLVYSLIIYLQETEDHYSLLRGIDFLFSNFEVDFLELYNHPGNRPEVMQFLGDIIARQI